ncbi:MAG TPA: hypothetical protein VGL58_16105 [Caulobacteraceae bacterium]|jgi:hypothetical protein
MAAPKYALFEHERRCLVLTTPDLSAAPVRLIEDRYVDGARLRLRLRRVTHFDGSPPELKFCKKYPADDPVSGPIVNIYLTEAEYALLAALPARPLTKRRYRMPHAGLTFGVDVFEGPLVGLVMCEKEAGSAEAIRQVVFPPWCGPEVTADPFFTGGHLSTLTANELATRLAAVIQPA